MTNDERQSIVLQFVAKPDEEVRVSLKEAGFQFKPEYCGQKNCWVQRNDFEGRLQLESVEKLLMIRSADAELPAF